MHEEPALQPAKRRRAVAVDLAFVALLLVAWYGYVGPIVLRDRMFGYDIFRDVGSAVNILHGRVFADPAYVGETIWYPPLGAAIAAGVSRVFEIPPEDYFRWSQLVFNWLIPAGLYLVTSLAWGQRAAIVGTVALLLAMPWWQVEVAHGQAAIHAVVWGWVGLLLYAQAERRRSYAWAVACGAWQGVSFWHHPFVPTVLAIGFVLQADWAARRGAGDEGSDESGVGRGRYPSAAGRLPALPVPDASNLRRSFYGRTAVVIGVTAVIAAPILYLIMHGPALNRDPREFLADELGTVRFALMRGNPWVWGMGLIGLVICAKRADLGSRLLVCCLAVTLAGQIPGYLRLYGGEWGKSVPMIVPHEFQRLFQLGWAIAVGVGVDRSIGLVTSRVTDARRRAPTAVGLTIVACLLTGVWWIGDVPDNLRRYLKPLNYPPQWVEATRWVRENTELDEVFACEPDLSFRWLNAKTGRKVWIMPPGHSNPRVDWIERAAVMRRMRDAATPERLWRLADDEGIRYLVPSPNWDPVALRGYSPDAEAARYFRPAHGGPGVVPIFEVRARPEGEPSSPEMEEP